MNLKKVIVFSGVVMMVSAVVLIVLGYQEDSSYYYIGAGQFLAGLALVLSNPIDKNNDNSDSK